MSTPIFETLSLDVEDGVATITLNRPEAANSLNRAMARELMNASIECSGNSDIRAVVLTGSGSFFCAGGDLKSFQAVGVDSISAHILETTTYLHAAVSRFARMDAPLIGAINGIAAGAGASLWRSAPISCSSPWLIPPPAWPPTAARPITFRAWSACAGPPS